ICLAIDLSIRAPNSLYLSGSVATMKGVEEN
ncbi:unnamed protein product, partial [marine sediment metagenome]